MDLRRRANGHHAYVRAIIENDNYKVVILQSDKQAEPSGRFRYIMADSTFDEVAPGSGKEGVSKTTIDASAAKAFDWHYFSIVYVPITFLLTNFCPVPLQRYSHFIIGGVT